MAKIDTLALLRARFRDAWRTPTGLVLLLVADVAETIASVALALASPPPAAPKPPYAALDVPFRPAQLTLGVAMLGVTVGVLAGIGLAIELWAMVRRAQIFRWRYGTARQRRLAGRHHAGLARRPVA